MRERSAGLASEATVEALELRSFLALIASGATTDLGRERILATDFAADLEELELRHRRYREATGLLVHGRLVPSFEEPLGTVLESLASGESEVVGLEMQRLATALRAVRSAVRAISEADPECVQLAEESSRLGDLAPFMRQIGRTLDRRGRVRDDASDRLVELGARVRKSRDSVYEELRGFSRKHSEDLAEETLPMHDGRVVVLLKAGARSRGKGLVHRGSGSGQSVYFEPLEVVDSNNRMREAQVRETEERTRLLNQLVEAARDSIDEIRGHLEFLALLDELQACHDFAELSGGRLIEISDRHAVKLVDVRHPLLEPRLAELRERVLGQRGHEDEIVPLRLEISSESRVVVVTGPNAGGKTVALKTVGLMTLAAQAALPFPAAAGTCAPLLTDLVATVGDEQDLLEDRSTFSGRLLRLQEAWRAAGPDSLLLLDELGSGTDPEEGAALSIALLEGLLERGAMAIITTHLTPLAAAALEADDATCAAMQFDSRSHRPTFELLPGSPAGSEALALARRLGLPDAWLDRADELLGGEQRDLRRLLAEVETVRDELVAQRAAVEDQAAQLARERESVSELEAELTEERKKIGRRSREELEAFKRKVSDELRDEVDRLRAELESGRRRGLAKSAVERLFEEAPVPEEDEPEGPEAALGDTVEHRSLRWKGVVERIDRSGAEVNVHGKRVRCALADLRVVSAEAPTRSATSASREPPGAGAPALESELNLIGRRVEEALEILDTYLDRALLAADGDVRIVHGHGSGRLRKAVREHLRTHPAAATHRPGRADEGGDGATVVSLRE